MFIQMFSSKKMFESIMYKHFLHHFGHSVLIFNTVWPLLKLLLLIYKMRNRPSVYTLSFSLLASFFIIIILFFILNAVQVPEGSFRFLRKQIALADTNICNVVVLYFF